MPKNKYILILNLVLISATLIAYMQVGNHGFVNLDDEEYITENGHIQNGITIEGLRWAFTTGHAANWHPLTWISHMLDIQFFGLEPRWHHLVNLLFHIANVLLLFFFLHRMTSALWQSAFVAALFALHPLHVESVAWISERKDVLSTFFWMLTLVAYGYYAGKPRLKTYLAVIAFFALGLLAKPMLVTLPFVLLLLDYWPLDRFAENRSGQGIPTEVNSPVPVRKKKGKPAKQAPKTTVPMEKPANREFQWASIRLLVLEKVPLLALTVFSCAATYIAQKKAGAVMSIEVYTPGLRMANALVSYLSYIAKTIWPDNLAAFYPHPGLLPFWQVLASALFLVAITFTVIRTAKRFPFLPVGWLWFMGTLVPVIGIVQVGTQAMADRYTYIPSIGLFIMAAWGIPEIFKRRRYRKETLAISSALCLLCLFVLTRIQVGYWRDSLTLTEHSLNVTGNNYVMNYNRGHVLERLGNHTQAIEDFTTVIKTNPRFGLAYSNRGICFIKLGNSAQALDDFNRAIEIDPHCADAFFNRGVYYHSSGDFRQAIEDYGMAIAANPEYSKAYFNRALVYGQIGQYLQAIDDYGRYISLNPRYSDAYFSRGMAYRSLGKESQAVEDIKIAARLGSEPAMDFLQKQRMNW